MPSIIVLGRLPRLQRDGKEMAFITRLLFGLADGGVVAVFADVAAAFW